MSWILTATSSLVKVMTAFYDREKEKEIAWYQAMSPIIVQVILASCTFATLYVQIRTANSQTKNRDREEKAKETE